MGMHISVNVKSDRGQEAIANVFEYFEYIDKKFSIYKQNSEISRINRGELKEENYSSDMKEILLLAEKTKNETKDFFNIKKADEELDPSGIVKGWAIWQAGLLLKKAGLEYFFIDAGGDIEACVANPKTQAWSVGIRNPFKAEEIVKVLSVSNIGVATSGNYERGDHIYNPHNPKEKNSDIVSLTVIGPNVYEADRFATAAFAMGRAGIRFIESLLGFEAYVIDKDGIGTETSGFKKFLKNYNA